MIKRIWVFGAISLFLAGCYQQATDNFETVDGSNAVSALPSATVQIIDPNASNGLANTPETPLIQDTTPTPMAVVIIPTLAGQGTPNETPTVLVIMPTLPSATPRPQDPLLVPTATPAGVITPQVPSQLIIPTATATTNGLTTSSNGLVTPTNLPLPTNEACLYTIKSGDSLFRIALNNEVSLDALLAENSLTQNSIIQPGQQLRIPNCDVTPTPTALADANTTTNGQTTAPIPLEGTNTGTTVTGGETYTVQAGDTLLRIANRYGVTVQAIVQANNLTNPDRISQGQQLIIPPRP